MFGLYKKFRPILYIATKLLTSDYFAGRVVFGFDQTIMRILPLVGSSSSERSVEYDWVLENLPSTKGKLLDIGSGASYFPSKLLYEGFEVYSLEVQMPMIQKSRIIFKQGGGGSDRPVAASTSSLGEGGPAWAAAPTARSPREAL